MKLTWRHPKALVALIIVSAVALTGFGCKTPAGRTPDENLEGSLVVWGLWQDSSMMAQVTKAFQDQTGVKVEYKKIASVATYEKELLEAIAEGRGPDVFVIHHTWVEDKRGLMAPAPASIITERQLQDEFVNVVADDVLRGQFIYALPTSVDTLALYYNQDLLNAAGVARPPRTWDEFQRAVEQTTRITRLGIIDQSGAALGTAANINRAPDILQLLMLQSGVSMYDRQKNDIVINTDIGERALTFYTDFSNKSKKVYTWDLQQNYSIDAFSEGKTAMMLNYSYHVPTIRTKNPRLRFAVAPVPQIADGTPVAFANYWPFAVSTSSRAPQTAWQFLRFMTNTQAAAAINEAQAAPPARRDSVEPLRSDPIMGVFADQSLIAASWPRVDIVAADAIFNAMIDDVVTGTIAIPDALRRAEDQLKQMLQK